MHGVVKIVVPLRVVSGMQEAIVVVVVFDHEMDAAFGRVPGGNRRAQFLENAGGALVEDHLGGVEAQAVEAVVASSHQRAFSMKNARTSSEA